MRLVLDRIRQGGESEFPTRDRPDVTHHVAHAFHAQFTLIKLLLTHQIKVAQQGVALGAETAIAEIVPAVHVQRYAAHERRMMFVSELAEPGVAGGGLHVPAKHFARHHKERPAPGTLRDFTACA